MARAMEFSDPSHAMTRARDLTKTYHRTGVHQDTVRKNGGEDMVVIRIGNGGNHLLEDGPVGRPEVGRNDGPGAKIWTH